VETDRPVVGKFVQKSLSQSGSLLQYTSDEKYCARVVTNEVQIYESGNLGTVWNKLHVEGVADFALSPGKQHSVAVFIPERKVTWTKSIYYLKIGKLIWRAQIGTTGRSESFQHPTIHLCSIAKDVLQGRQGSIKVE
jgi:uncharacterized protein with WD repeat